MWHMNCYDSMTTVGEGQDKYLYLNLLREKLRSAHVTSRMIIHAPIIVNSVCERKCCPRSIW